MGKNTRYVNSETGSSCRSRVEPLISPHRIRVEGKCVLGVRNKNNKINIDEIRRKGVLETNIVIAGIIRVMMICQIGLEGCFVRIECCSFACDSSF